MGGRLDLTKIAISFKQCNKTQAATPRGILRIVLDETHCAKLTVASVSQDRAWLGLSNIPKIA
jgi:hypothetical protein